MEFYSKIVRNRALLILAFIIAFLAYSFWDDFGEVLKRYVSPEVAEEASSFFFFFNIEFAFTLYTYLIFLYAKEEGNIWNIEVSRFVNLAALGAIIDRVFFDPYTTSINDYIIYLINIIVLILYVRFRIKKTDRVTGSKNG